MVDITDDRDDGVATLRAFNRVYTNRLGLLRRHLDGSPFTLTEARLLYELGHRPEPTAAELGRALAIDRAQLSRTMKRFETRGLVRTRDDPRHARQQRLALTAAGRRALVDLDGRTRLAIGELLAGLAPARRTPALAAARLLTAVFGSDAPPAVRLRGLEAGDLGRVVERQAMVYAAEYGWNQDYEALVARIVADFRRDFDPAFDDAWIAEADGRMVGSVFLVRGDGAGVGKLRLLYVEPDARGLGVGRRLVEACIDRARAIGHQRLELWTNSVLVAARRLYEGAGFQLVSEQAHRSFGHDLVGQVWSLDLGAAAIIERPVDSPGDPCHG